MIKKYLSLLGIAVLLFFCACSSQTELVSHSKSDFKIFISKNAAKPEQYAARELQKYLQKISGCLLPIVNENKADDKMIYIGFQNAPHALTHDLKPAAFGKEEYIIRSDGKNLLIAGGAPRGTLYGVLGYLGDIWDAAGIRVKS
ncbi:alpha-glucuronidase family glycosyl hydrolase [Dyadobacter sp. LHD-138]|uniref:alpha-glucuronidase family glycosyl hydrolase n=1 Tax=Dyadobacter sp. LHD-138 TaxID=3071413 RepID=UPI0027DEB7ED|nr:alpha-glucuronidase family glycosyl hydrolase [Dyadobacter sp. LHD-138]MDQ6480082.1 alpha-glucuronidase family glycosyl hydrolase [Dyadobacter sp. LHD-138]